MSLLEECKTQFEAEARNGFRAGIAQFGWGCSIIGAALWILGYLFVTSFNAAAENQVRRIRSAFLKGILKQDIGWYDTHETGDFASRMTG